MASESLRIVAREAAAWATQVAAASCAHTLCPIEDAVAEADERAREYLHQHSGGALRGLAQLFLYGLGFKVADVTVCSTNEAWRILGIRSAGFVEGIQVSYVAPGETLSPRGGEIVIVESTSPGDLGGVQPRITLSDIRRMLAAMALRQLRDDLLFAYPAHSPESRLLNDMAGAIYGDVWRAEFLEQIDGLWRSGPAPSDDAP